MEHDAKDRLGKQIMFLVILVAMPFDIFPDIFVKTKNKTYILIQIKQYFEATGLPQVLVVSLFSVWDVSTLSGS